MSWDSQTNRQIRQVKKTGMCVVCGVSPVKVIGGSQTLTCGDVDCLAKHLGTKGYQERLKRREKGRVW